MNQSPGDVEAEAQKPEDKKNGEDGPKHCGPPSAYVESLGCCRVLAKAHPMGIGYDLRLAWAWAPPTAVKKVWADAGTRTRPVSTASVLALLP